MIREVIGREKSVDFSRYGNELLFGELLLPETFLLARNNPIKLFVIIMIMIMIIIISIKLSKSQSETDFYFCRMIFAYVFLERFEILKNVVDIRQIASFFLWRQPDFSKTFDRVINLFYLFIYLWNGAL